MHDYKSNFTNALDYGYQKTKLIWWKIFLMGMLASIYVAIAYVAYIYILSWYGNDELLRTGEFHLTGSALFVASLIFPVGLMMITILGGSLFTSDTLAMLAVFDKKARLYKVFRNLGIVFLGNLVGALIAAAVLRGASAFKGEQLRVIEYLITKKVSSYWYEILFSSMFSNLIVAGTVWSTLATRGAIGKIFIIFFFIWLFTVTGFHHVIANLIIFAFGWLFADVEYIQYFKTHEEIISWSQQAIDGGIITSDYLESRIIDFTKASKPTFESMSFGYKDSLYNIININSSHKLPAYSFDWTLKAFFVNALPALVGNWFSGAIVLPVSYWAVVKFKVDKYGTIDSEIIMENEIKEVIQNTHVDDIHEAEKIAYINLKQKQREEIKKELKKELWFDKIISKIKNKNKK
ncbi:formate/nitrite transporter family protein [Mesomycoplasma molare]|uniref:Formate/nitrite transporter family protein n=1 Tax=Mesomycoplasma molare TaxID=171288 RepID=A0ABY5TVJ4_9BACT|nr:formate/nitrite transporter family protein [Mesomycoplasma molare]UWD34255.1 formate/nitrite transporter family protein [Mesomycoplasma molare]